jgi:hypothetical protein
VSNPAFQDLPALVLSTINRYNVKHPDVKLPENFPRIVGLVARAKDSSVASAKKGEPSALFLLSYSMSHIDLLAVISAANLRPEKTTKKNKTVVSHIFLLLIFY